MICTSIQNKTLDQLWEILDDPYVEMAEIRLDLCDLTDSEIEELFSVCEKPLVATCRTQSDWEVAVRKLEIASQAGARYVDLDISAPAKVSQHIQKVCKETGSELIRSFHDFSGTPSVEYLLQVIARCYRYGADIAKVVTTATCEADCALIESLYTIELPQEQEFNRNALVAFAMGEAGRATRIECLKNGAPFSYASYDAPTAPGQIDFEQMHKSVYGEFNGLFRNDFITPASKSFAQRAIVAAALAKGESHLRNFTPCDDSNAAIELAKALGASVELEDNVLTIRGIGPLKDKKLGLDSIHTGESGLLTRLMIPLMSLLNGKDFTVEGRGTLCGRPLSGASDIMASFGVILRNLSDHDNKELYVPLKVCGSLIPGNAEIDGTGGSQLISGLLMVLPLCSSPSKVFVSEPKSIPYMFITIDVLRKFGITIGSQLEGDAEMLENQDWTYCDGVTFQIKGGQSYKAADIDLEGDWSAAANFLVAGAIYGGAEVSELDPSSLQADISIMDVLVEAGACASAGEGAVSVRKAPLEAFDFDLSQAPDLFPIVSVLAAFCPGISTIAGVERLRNKESDRAASILEMLEKLGVECRVDSDIMAIRGESLTSRLLNGNMLKGGEFSSHHDHRMAMALKVASVAADGPVVVDDRDCVSKSFPDFYEQF